MRYKVGVPKIPQPVELPRFNVVGILCLQSEILVHSSRWRRQRQVCRFNPIKHKRSSRQCSPIGVGDRGQGDTCPLPQRKIRKKNFSGNVKIGHFVNFSYIFLGKNVVPPKVDWAPTPMYIAQLSVVLLLP